MILEVILLVCAAVTLAGLYYRFNYSGRLLHKIAGPKGVSIFGNAFEVVFEPELTKDPFTFFRSLYTDYGHLSKTQSFFLRSVHVYEPADFEVILSNKIFNEKRIPYTFLKPWLGQGLLLNNGESWFHRRKILTPAFHFIILKKFTRTFIEHTEDLFENIQEETNKDKTELMPLIMKYTLRVICETAMGTTLDLDIETLSNKYVTALHELGKCTLHRVIRPWLYFDWIFSRTTVGRAYRSALNDLHGFTKQIIQERREYRQRNNMGTSNDDKTNNKKDKLALLDLLLDQEQEGKIDIEGIREEVDTFMFEGYDTTAMALSFMLMRIANEPEVQENIYKELKSIFGNSSRELLLEDLAEMKYLECCIKEAMRLYPSVPAIVRYLTEDVTLSGYKVPAGTLCILQIYDLHHRKDIYPSPEKFIPERFLQENVANRHTFAYLPFSAGARNCIGQKFAMYEMKIAMSGILRKFYLEPVTKAEDCQFVCDLTLRPKNPIYVRFRNRVK